MNPYDILDKLLCEEEELTSKERDAFIEGLKSDPELVRVFVGWLQVRSHLMERLPETKDLILYSLVADGHADDLTHQEASYISDHWKDIDSVVESHSGFKDVTHRIVQDRQDFLDCWGSESRSVPHVFKLPAWSYQIAAVIAILAVAFIATIFLVNYQDRSMHMAVATPGEYQRVLLPDSSIVHLSGPATLEYHSEKFGRSVQLTGQAFFEITHQPKQFIVRTNEAMVQVLGTRFGMRSGNDMTQVILESGRVQVTSNETPPGSIVLSPGQMTDVIKGEAPTPSVDVKIEDELRWTGFVFLRNTPMRKAAVLLSSSRNVNIDVDPLLMAESVTGTFSPDIPIQEVLDALKLTLNAQVIEDEDGFRIIPLSP